MYQISLEEKMIPYTIKYSRRKSIGIEITYEGDLVVKAPINAPIARIEQLLKEKERWILTHIEHCKQREVVKDKNEILFQGERLTIQVIEQPLQLIGIKKEDNTLIIKKPEGYQLDLNRVIEEWLRKQAVSMLQEKVKFYSKIMNVTYQNITIKDQKTRWGSCSSKGNLNFNYRLIMAPEKVLEYVVVHELAHRKQMNHSKAFWDIVEQIMPEYKQYRNWLSEYGGQLMF